MRKTLLIATLIFISGILYSQTVFNRIIADTAANIMNSVIVVDTGYVYLTGTGNINGIRCYSINYVDNSGNRVWKKLSPIDNNQIWEGWDDNFRIFNNEYSLSSNYNNTEANLSGIHISTFDSLFNINEFHTFLNDTIDKRVFQHIRSNCGDYYLTGQIYDYEQGDQYHLYLMKVDCNWHLCWQKEYGNYIYEYGSYIMQTSSGSILTGGETWLTGINKTMWYLINTDTSGNIIWERYYGRNNFRNGAISGLIETSDSCYLACGSYPGAKFGSGSGTILWDGCLRKIDTEGDVIWTRYFKSYLLSHTGSIFFQNQIYAICEKNDDIYILGWNYNYVSWNDRAYLAKLDKDGNMLWKREYYAVDTNSYDQYLKVLKPTNDNGFILAGYGDQYGSYGYNPPQQSWLVKTDSLGLDGLSNTELPELNIDMELPDTVCMDDTLGVYAFISGKSAPYTLEFSTGQVIDSIYYPPTFVPVEIGLTYINLTWGGSTFFEETITEATLTNHEWGQCIARPVEFFTPHTPGPQQITITVTDAYGESKTISKSIVVNDCGVGMENFDNEAIKIYPNPANKSLTICLPGNTNQATAVITDVLGRVYGRYDLQGKESEIDISHLQPGNYFLQITFNGKTENLRFVKE